MNKYSPQAAKELYKLNTKQRADLAAYLLEGLEPGHLPFPLFKELRRLVVMSTLELVPLYISKGELHVLLGLRPTGSKDPWWGGKLNLPGSVLLANETFKDYHDFETPSDRILREEFNGTIRRVSDIHIFDNGLTTSISGKENKMWAWAEVTLSDHYNKPEGGDFYEVNKLLTNPPGILVEGHMATIKDGLKAYQDYKDLIHE